MKRMIASLVVLVSLVSFVGTASAQTLSAQSQQALIDAINDEYKARATYQKVLDTFGSVRPFANIIQSEQHHIEELLPLFEKYGVAVPEDTWYAQVPAFVTIEDALKAAVEAEIENAKMYDQLFAMVTEADIITVFTELRDASQDHHLPAFQRGLDRPGNGLGSAQAGQTRGAGNRGH